MNKVYEIVTNKILDEMKNGVIPWHKPWNPIDAPRNIRGTRYNGINVFLLMAAQQRNGYTSNTWMTFNQVAEMGGSVEGQKSTLVIFMKKFQVESKDDPGKMENRFSMRYYNVFNQDQVSGIEFPKPADVPAVDPIQAADEVVKNMPKAPEIIHGGDRACYSPTLDHVRMPKMEAFKNAEGYYQVLFHELGHSTGHESRLGRFDASHNHNFGSVDYSKEELVAEMTAAFLMGATGIEGDVKNSAAYIQGWSKALQDDKTLIVKAASAAQKAADYILGSYTPSDDTE